MRKRILVVEDDPAARRLISYTLEQEGHRVLTASSGPEGLEKAREEEPDLLILDVMLPRMDGFQVCRRLRSESCTSHTPILMLSAKARDIDKASGFKVGADEYLTKPTDPSELVSRVQSLLMRADTEHVRTIAFLGCKGGVGTSTVAANTAVALAQKGKGVILVDLCSYGGTVAAFLGLKPEHTVAELCDRAGGVVDPQKLEAVLTTHTLTGVRVLASPQVAEGYRELSPAGADSLVEGLRSMADYVVADVPAHSSEAAKAVLQRCDLVVLVADSWSGTLIDVKSAAALFHKMGIDQQHLAAVDISRQHLATVIVDREGLFSNIEYSKMKPIVESILRIPLLGIIAHDTEASTQFEPLGVPVALTRPTQPTATALRQLAEQLAMYALKAPEGGK